MLPVPNGWKKDSSNIVSKFHSDIGIDNVWINENSNAVLVQYTIVERIQYNVYVELYENPRKVTSRFRQIKNLLSSDKKDIEMQIISMSDKNKSLVAKVSDQKQAKEEAYRYMSNNPNAENKPNF